MPRYHHNAVRAGRVVSLLRAWALLALALFAAPALAIDSGDIVVVSVRGEVQVTMKGAERKVRAGGVLELPATVRTGRDGTIELRQGATTLSVAPGTLLEFPALEKPGAPVDRIVQPRGNAFYNIGKREGRRLRIETPFLVGVVKGTQFNVAANEDSTTISLFEGLLEVRSVEDAAMIDLKAGEIASRRRGDRSINVTPMDAGKVPPTGTRQPDGGTSSSEPGPVSPRHTAPEDSFADVGAGNAGVLDTVTQTLRPVDVAVDVRTPVAIVDTQTSVEVGVVVDSNAGSLTDDPGAVAEVGGQGAADAGPVSADVDASVSAGVDVTGVTADVSADVGISAGPVAVDAGVVANVDTGAGGTSVDISNETTVDAGPVSVGVDNSASVDLGSTGASVDLSNNMQIDPGAVSADVGNDIAVDAGLGGASVDISNSTQVDTGPASVDVGNDISVDAGLGGASVDISNNTQVDAGPASVDVGNDISVDASLGGASVDISHGTQVDAGPASVDVGNDISVDAGPGGAGVDASLGAQVDAGPISTDLDVGAAVDVGAGAAVADLSTSTTVDAGVITADVATDTSVDISSGTVDLGVSVGGLDLGVGVDLGLDQDDDTETDTSTPPTDTGNNETIDVGGLLDGLLRRPGRR